MRRWPQGVSFGTRGNLILLAPPLVIDEQRSRRRAGAARSPARAASSRPPDATGPRHELPTDLRDDVQPARARCTSASTRRWLPCAGGLGATPRAATSTAGRGAQSSCASVAARSTASCTLGRVSPLASRADVDAAMRGGAASVPGAGARRRSPSASRLMRRVADVMEQRVYEIAAALALEVGKNRMEALGEAQETVDFFRLLRRRLREPRRLRPRAAGRSARRASSRAIAA